MDKKELIIDCISELVYQSTWKQTAFDNRLKGFRAEILAPIELNKGEKYKFFKGGWILPITPKKRFNESKVLYLTIMSKKDFVENKRNYIEIYTKLKYFKYKYLAVYEINFDELVSLSTFSDLKFPKINISFYKYSEEDQIFIKSKYLDVKKLFNASSSTQNTHIINKDILNILESFSEDILEDILADRYVFDYLFGIFNLKHGIPCDFDMIVQFKELNNKYVIYEIKEKDKSKKNKNKNNVVGFGMDIQRINDYKILINKFSEFHFRYLVREIDNQRDRNFIGWRSLGMKLFTEYALHDPLGKSGGVGMLPDSEASKIIKTAICPYEKFKVVE